VIPTGDDGTGRADVSERFVSLDGCFNFRDLGGYPAAGGRTVRRGLVYRSDALHRLSARGTDAFRALTIATAIDLRAPAELARHAWQPPPEWPGQLLRVPLRQAIPDWASYPGGQLDDPGFAAQHYVETTERGHAAIRKVVETLADPSRLPAVFHCAAGKDRTGIIAALTLALLGVPAERIADDYALSDIATQRWEASIAAGTPDDTQTSWAYVPPAMLTAERSTMTAFLRQLMMIHGTPDRFAATIGITSQALRGLRENLLAPGHQLRAEQGR
jgi:protein-tyrosine phosphatase